MGCSMKDQKDVKPMINNPSGIPEGSPHNALAALGTNFSQFCEAEGSSCGIELQDTLTPTYSVSKSYRRAERSRKIKKRKINHRESLDRDENGDAILPDPPQDMGDMDARDAGDWHIQDDDIPGPSQQSPAHSPQEPEPNAAPLRSNHSGRVMADGIMAKEENHAGNELISFETDPDTMGLY
ncbi:hypothetical protein BDR05DRAFT_1006518 [Suillus weaverae]|nr:hypothetical protein BDR05DRAFT_1006518 [Suillus weaverae]